MDVLLLLLQAVDKGLCNQGAPTWDVSRKEGCSWFYLSDRAQHPLGARHVGLVECFAPPKLPGCRHRKPTLAMWESMRQIQTRKYSTMRQVDIQPWEGTTI